MPLFRYYSKPIVVIVVQAKYMRDDADEDTVARHLEAYLMWLFGWVMFCSSQGNSMPKHLLPYAREIADAPLDDVPQFSWGSAVLAATYRGLCAGCSKVSSSEPIFVGCPLLLQLWSWERLPIGRPQMDFSPYQLLPMHEDEVDRPTMGSLWCLRKVCLYRVNVKNLTSNANWKLTISGFVCSHSGLESM